MIEIEEETIEIRRYVGIFLAYWWLLLILAVVGGVLGYLYSAREELVYEAQATLLVQHRGSSFSLGVSDVGVSRQLATTYAKLITASPFLTKIQEDNDTPLSLGGIKPIVYTDPPMLEIRVRDRDSNLAATTADVVAQGFIEWVFQERLAEIARLQQAAAAQGITNVQDLVAAQFAAVDSLSILEPVGQPRAIRPQISKKVILGAILGAMIAGGLALLLASLSDTVRDPEEVERRFGITTLGSVFTWSTQEIKEREIVVWKAPSSGYSESFRQIRTNFQFATSNQTGNAFLVTSPGPGEGKSAITSNLAVALAQTGKRVAIIDGDLRRPSIHKLFQPLQREPGLSNMLAGHVERLSDVVHSTEVEGVSVVPAGPTPPNPSELIGSPRMSALLEQMKREFDIVLVDSPPSLVVADAAILAAQLNGAIVVVDGLNTRSSSLRAALGNLRNTQVNILGVVINRLKRARFSYGYPYYYDYYYYSYYGSPEPDKTLLDGRGPIYRRPVDLVKSALSRIRKHGDQS